MNDERPVLRHELAVEIAGIGIILYSPSSASHIGEGDDYLSDRYLQPADVQEHIQAGSIVAFGTGSPGRFVLRFFDGYPSPAVLDAASFTLRLGLRSDGTVVVRDLYDLMDWTKDPPPGQAIPLPAGIYHVTLCSDRPGSGILGDDQVIEVYLQRLDEFPRLAPDGIPTLC